MTAGRTRRGRRIETWFWPEAGQIGRSGVSTRQVVHERHAATCDRCECDGDKTGGQENPGIRPCELRLRWGTHGSGISLSDATMASTLWGVVYRLIAWCGS